MRTRYLLSVIRKLPPRYQLGVSVLLVVGIGVVWLADQMGYQSQIDDFTQSFKLPSSRTPDAPRRKTSPNDPRKTSVAQGSFKYFSLVLSWSPTHCETNGRGRKNKQCGGGHPYGFVLHGLWPQHSKGWPENCQTGQKPFVPNDVIREISDIMPSRGLIIHEYRKHGTCSGMTPKRYFALSRSLFNKVRIPPRYVRPQKAFQTSPRDVESAFLRANPGLTADMISVVCGGSGRLKELRICFAKDGKLVRCGANEEQRRLCSKDQIRVPPVRGG